jgi:hypothetical protein
MQAAFRQSFLAFANQQSTTRPRVPLLFIPAGALLLRRAATYSPLSTSLSTSTDAALVLYARSIRSRFFSSGKHKQKSKRGLTSVLGFSSTAQAITVTILSPMTLLPCASMHVEEGAAAYAVEAAAASHAVEAATY